MGLFKGKTNYQKLGELDKLRARNRELERKRTLEANIRMEKQKYRQMKYSGVRSTVNKGRQLYNKFQASQKKSRKKGKGSKSFFEFEW